MRSGLSVLALSLCLSGCGDRQETSSAEDYRLTEVTLPHGQKIKCEVMRHKVDMARGLMFRDSLAPDRGMLFIHGSAANYPYWMYKVNFPLDIIWMNNSRQVVEISENTPPCTGKPATQCPNYGGAKPSVIVLELLGGSSAKYGIRVGDTINF